jgi:hypothetical protein
MSVELGADQREELIGVLVGNIELDGYSPVFNEADLEFVSSLDNDQLLRLAPLATNEEEDDDEEEDVTDNGGGMYGKKDEMKKKKRSLVGFTDEELEDEMKMRKSKNYGQKMKNGEHPMKKEKNMGKMKKTANVSAQEWLESAPEEIRSVVANAIQREESLREELIEKITGNENNTLDSSEYQSLPINVLQGIAGLCESKVVANSEQNLYDLFKRPNYAGQASPRPVANTSGVTPLVEPQMDWSTMSS